MKAVDEIVQKFLLAAIIGEAISEKERDLYSLPVQSGGLGIPLFSEKTCNGKEKSLIITTPLVNLIITQGTSLPNAAEIKEATKIITQRKTEQFTNKSSKIEANLGPDTKRAVTQAKKKGTSCWLTVLPIEEHGFTLTKNEFRGAIHLPYNKALEGMPSQCPYGRNYEVIHSMNCKRGGFIRMRYNNVRDFETNLPETNLNDVEVEPKLQKIDNEELNGLTGDDARPDIGTRGVWRQGQNAFFDIRLAKC